MAAHVMFATLDVRGQLTGIGRAHRLARATVEDGRLVDWQETEVKWDESHDLEGEGNHHASIAKYLLAERATELVAAGAGPGMRLMLEKMGLRVILASGTARETVTALARLPRSVPAASA